MKEPCPDFLERLAAYADGELDAAEARRVEEHVASCDACRETLRAWRDADAALAGTDVARSDVEWERLARRVESAIDAEEGRSIRRGRSRTSARTPVSSST